MTDGVHSAAASALGYWHQSLWPLPELIERSRDLPDCRVALELADDVVWENVGSPKELVQLKHHTTASASLTDSSVDLWRTINVWLDAPDVLSPDGPRLALVTTASAPAGSVAACLCPKDIGSRDEATASELLHQAALSSTSTTTTNWRKRFCDLLPEDRKLLLAKIEVIGDTPGIDAHEDRLRRALHTSIPRGQADLFLGLVQAWWVRQALALLRREIRFVSGLEVLSAIENIRDQFSDGHLPTVVDLGEFDDSAIDAHRDNRFVRQLQWVGTPGRVLRKYIEDYLRATTQSATWIENHLVDLPEVEHFRRRLIDEWEREFLWMVASLPDTATEEERTSAGQKLLRQTLDSTSITIRPHYSEQFYVRGKLHELADAGSVGWHPDYEAMLEDLLLGESA